MQKHRLCHAPDRLNSIRPHAPVAVALGLAGGILLARGGPPPWLPAVGVTGLLVGALAGPRRWIRWTGSPCGLLVAILAVAAVAGAIRFTTDNHTRRHPGLLHARVDAMKNRETVRLRGTVAREPTLRSPRTVGLVVLLDEVRFHQRDPWQAVPPEYVDLSVYTRRSASQSGNIRDVLPALSAPTACGARIEAEVRVSPDINAYLDMGRFWLLGTTPPVRARAYWKRVHTMRPPNPWNPAHALLRGKVAMIEIYQRYLPDPVYRLAAGAVLGDRGPVRVGTFRQTPIRELFAHAGIGHVLAVSGLHVGIVAAGLIGLLRLVRVPPRWIVAPVALALLGYVVVTGFRPATTRAALMAVVGYSVYAFRGRGAGSAAWVGISIAASFLLVYRPALLFDVGFQLSFGAVISLLLLTRPIEQWLARQCRSALIVWAGGAGGLLCLASAHMDLLCTRPGLWGLGAGAIGATAIAHTLNRRAAGNRSGCRHRLPRAARSLIAAQLAIQLGIIIPLSGLYFGRFSIAGTVVNLAVIPLMGLFVPAALLTGLAALVPGVGPALASIPAAVTTLTGLGIFEAAAAGARAFAYPDVPALSGVQLAAYYLALVAMLHAPALSTLGQIARPPLQHSLLDIRYSIFSVHSPVPDSPVPAQTQGDPQP